MKPISNKIAVSVFYALVVDKTDISRLLRYLGTKYPLAENVLLKGIVRSSFVI